MVNKIYKPPIVTVDAVIFQLIDGVLNVLLVERSNAPFKGDWALPGGYCAEGETTLDALTNKVKAKAGLDINKITYLEQLFTFDAVARDPRGHAVSVSYLAIGRNITPNNPAENATFCPVNDLPKLAFDHKNIIEMGKERLRSKLTYTNIAFALLDKNFTLTELQTAYEAVYGHELDKRNFRKKYLALDLIKDTGEKTSGTAYRPAKLYTYKSQKLKALERSFD